MNSDFSLRELHEHPSPSLAVSTRLLVALEAIHHVSSAGPTGAAYLLNCPVHPICVPSDGLGPDNDHETLCRLRETKHSTTMHPRTFNRGRYSMTYCI